MIFKKEHVELKDITKNEKDEIKELFTNAEQRLNNLKTQEDIESVCNHINGYEFMINTSGMRRRDFPVIPGIQTLQWRIPIED